MLTLRYYSPRAYNYFRGKFNNNLPHPSTIRKWYQQSSVQVESGILTANMKILEAKVQELQQHGQVLQCGLIHDEMSIRQHVQWLNEKKKMSGFITFGKVDDDGAKLPIATNVIVFLLSGINIPFHMPIAYYFINKLEGVDKVVLLSLIIKKLTEIGVNVLTVTYDGDPANITACEILGSQYDTNDLHPEFKNPYNESSIFPFLDPPHMLKLIRNHLSSCRTMYDREGRPIEWKYFERLVAIKNQDGLSTHKMTTAHINYSRNEMRVSLAAQTFSQSAALSMESLMRRKYPGFENTDGTIEFTKRLDTLFDTMNSDQLQTDNRFKSPINVMTKIEIFQFLDDTADYLKRLTHQKFKNPVINSSIKVGFKGMLINIANIKKIYLDLVETKKLDDFPVRRIVQCSLESFFSRCRSHSLLGCNTNPTVQQFQACMRKIQVNNEITSSAFANCIDQLDILQVSSKVSNQIDGNIMVENQSQQEENIENIDDLLASVSQNANNIVEAELFAEPSASNEAIGIAFTAGQIEKKIECDVRAKDYLFARTVFAENEKLRMDGLPLCKNTKIPCYTTYEICAIAHRILEPDLLKSDFNYSVIMNNIVSETESKIRIFCQTDFSSKPEYKFQLLQLIAEKYISIRATFIAKKLTMENQDLRRKKVKQHFQGY